MVAFRAMALPPQDALALTRPDAPRWPGRGVRQPRSRCWCGHEVTIIADLFKWAEGRDRVRPPEKRPAQSMND